MEARLTVRIVNPSGLHARPCHSVVTTAAPYQSKLWVCYEGRCVNGKSILELMTLNAGPEAELELVAQGGDAPALLESLGALFQSGFGERP